MNSEQNQQPPRRFIAALAVLLAMLAGRGHAASAGFASNQTYSGKAWPGQTIDVSGLSNVTFSGCSMAAVTFPGGCADVTVDHCTFSGGGNLTACSGNVPVRFKFTNNKVVGAGEGVHWFGGPSGVASGTIDDNQFSGIARNPIEVQEVFTGLEIARNTISSPAATVAPGGGMGISCATGAYFNKTGTSPVQPDSTGVTVHDNVIDQRGITNKGLAQIVGVEFMGGGGNCSHNYIVGCDTALVYCETGCFGLPWTANNNAFVTCRNAMGAEPSNNGYSTCTSPTNPTGNTSYASLAAAGCPPLPASATAWAGNTTVTPIVVATPAVSTVSPLPGLTAKPSDTSVTLTWTNAIQSPAVVVKATHGGVYPTVQYSDSRNSATIIGLHPGWQFDFNVTAAGQSGTIAGLQMTGDSTQQQTVNPRGVVSTSTKSVTVTTYTDGSTSNQ